MKIPESLQDWGCSDGVKLDFTNELGNDITIDVSKDIVGQPPRERVNIKIIGPISMSENIITIKEAKVLQRLLNEYFGT